MNQTWSKESSLSGHYEKVKATTLSDQKSMLDTPPPPAKKGAPLMVYFHPSLTWTKLDQKEVLCKAITKWINLPPYLIEEDQKKEVC